MYNVGSMGSVRKSYPSDYAKVEHQVINHWDCTENRASDISRGRGAAKFREIRKIHKNTKNIAKFGRNLIKYRKNSCISRTPNFQAWFWKKKKTKNALL